MRNSRKKGRGELTVAFFALCCKFASHTGYVCIVFNLAAQGAEVQTNAVIADTNGQVYCFALR